MTLEIEYLVHYDMANYQNGTIVNRSLLTEDLGNILAVYYVWLESIINQT
jgi:hypothetical protein